MYGQKPRHPVNLYFGTKIADMNIATSAKFVQHLHERLKWAYKTAQYVIEKENQRHKQNYGHKIRCTQLGVGDQVFSRGQPLKANIKSRTIEKILCIMLRGNHIAHCQF